MKEETWTFEEYVKETEAKNRRDFDIIVHYWETKKYNFPSKAAANSDLKVCLRPAQILRDYPNNRIVQVMDWLEKHADFPWKLTTVVKYINEDLNKLKKKHV